MTKKKKRIVISVIVISIIAGGVYYYFFSPYSEKRKSNKEVVPVVNQMKDIAQDPTASINPSKKTDIDALLKQKKYKEAQDQINQLLGEANLSDADKSELYTQLAEVCSALKDVNCAAQVIDHYKTALSPDLDFVIKFARMAKQQGRTDISREWYKFALELIEQRGGIEEVNKLYETAGSKKINIKELEEGAR